MADQRMWSVGHIVAQFCPAVGCRELPSLHPRSAGTDIAQHRRRLLRLRSAVAGFRPRGVSRISRQTVCKPVERGPNDRLDTLGR